MRPLTYQPLEHQLMSFSTFLRQHGFTHGIQETLDLIRSVEILERPTELNIRVAGKSILCSNSEDHRRFNPLFDDYWKGDSKRFKSNLSISKRFKEKQGINSLIWMGKTSTAEDSENEPGRQVSGANQQERLRKTDFSKLSELESQQLEVLAKRLYREMDHRLSRRWRGSYGSGKLDLRRTIRQNISSGDNWGVLRFKRRKPRKPRLVVFLDVSGSMDTYSFYLLKFIYELQTSFQQVETFLFSTRLHYISDLVRKGQLPVVLDKLKFRAEGWSSGTTMGSCLRVFNRDYAKFILSRKSVVLVLSDGLDTGDTEILSNELKQISRRTRKIIWLNPLMGMKGYQPLAKGMRTAMPILDIFAPAHNLQSLLELEKHLQHV